MTLEMGLSLETESVCGVLMMYLMIVFVMDCVGVRVLITFFVKETVLVGWCSCFVTDGRASVGSLTPERTTPECCHSCSSSTSSARR